jgi:TM2 domain-containing membrane protein YozV
MTNASAPSLLAANMTEDQRALYFAQMSVVEKDEVAGVLLALFLGIFGAHHFYLRRTGLGILYVLFSWTGIPALAGFIECFFMPGRVRRYNYEQAVFFAASVQGATAGYEPPLALPAQVTHCTACGNALQPGVRFCATCGAPA